jgi:hypothetical protein
MDTKATQSFLLHKTAQTLRTKIKEEEIEQGKIMVFINPNSTSFVQREGSTPPSDKPSVQPEPPQKENLPQNERTPLQLLVSKWPSRTEL